MKETEEIKEGSVAYVAGTSQAPGLPATEDDFSAVDPQAVQRAEVYRRAFVEADEEVKRLISANPRIMHGVPCITGTRIPVYMIVSLIEEGYSYKRILTLYPQITEAQIKAALRYAVDALERLA